MNTVSNGEPDATLLEPHNYSRKQALGVRVCLPMARKRGRRATALDARGAGGARTGPARHRGAQVLREDPSKRPRDRAAWVSRRRGGRRPDPAPCPRPTSRTDRTRTVVAADRAAGGVRQLSLGSDGAPARPAATCRRASSRARHDRKSSSGSGSCIVAPFVEQAHRIAASPRSRLPGSGARARRTPANARRGSGQ